VEGAELRTWGHGVGARLYDCVPQGERRGAACASCASREVRWSSRLGQSKLQSCAACCIAYSSAATMSPSMYKPCVPAWGRVQGGGHCEAKPKRQKKSARRWRGRRGRRGRAQWLAVVSTVLRGKVVAACSARHAAQAEHAGPDGVAPLVAHRRRVGIVGGDGADRLVVKLGREGRVRVLAVPVGVRRLDILHRRQEADHLRALRAAIREEGHGLRKTGDHNRLLDLVAAVEAKLTRSWRLRRCGSER
jgi:hypothetical protein